MKIVDYITNDFAPLKLSTKVSEAKVYFEILPFTHFPVVENGKLMGILSRIDLMEYVDQSKEIKELHHYFEHFYVGENIHCIDLITLFAQNNADILPVVNAEFKYLGYYELDDILALFRDTPFLQENSTTLIIEKEKSSYTMSEISQIIETNNIPLLGMYISKTTKNLHQITLRLGTSDVNEVIQSFRRYDYQVLTENKDDLLLEQLKERSDYLQKYLDI